MNNTPSHPEANDDSGSGQGNGNSRQSGGPGQATARGLVPLTVWLCPDTTGTGDQNAKIGNGSKNSAAHTPSPAHGRGGAAVVLCPRHSPAASRELARHLITSCTAEGDVVAQAYPSNEAMLVAAAKAGRRAVSCVPHFPLAQHLGARLREQLTAEELRRVAMRSCGPDQMHLGMADQVGRVRLLVAEPPAYETGGRTFNAVKDCPACRADFWLLSHDRLAGMLTSAWRVLRPGGVLAVITTARHSGDGRLIDPAPRIIRQATGMGFIYVQHVIALRVPIEGDALLVQATPTSLAHLHDPRIGRLPSVASVHADLCLLIKPRQQRRGCSR